MARRTPFRGEVARRRANTLRQIRSLHEIPAADLQAVTQRMLRAATRAVLHDEPLFPFINTALLYISLGGPVTLVAYIAPRPGSTAYQECWAILGLGAVFGSYTMANAFGKVAAVRMDRRVQLTAHFVGRAYALTLPLTLIFLISYYAFDPKRDKVLSASDLHEALVVDLIALVILCLRSISWAKRRGAMRRHPRQELDMTMLKLLSVASRIARARERGKWSSAEARSAVRDLEAVAWAAEYYPPFNNRRPLGDTRSRAFLRQEGARLAAVVRLHKTPLLTALAPSQLSAVEASICQAFSAWERGDWEALTASSPAVSVPRRWFTVWQRMWPALTLASFAVALPHIHQLGSQQVSSNIRISLLVAAALSVITGGVPVADRVQETVSKSLAWKEAKN